jgi:hypothetical protein
VLLVWYAKIVCYSVRPYVRRLWNNLLVLIKILGAYERITEKNSDGWIDFLKLPYRLEHQYTGFIKPRLKVTDISVL